MPRLASFLPAMLLSIGLGACAHSPASTSLYQQVGGQAGVERLSERLLQRVHADVRIAELFVNVDAADLKRLVAEQLCEALGGPCRYSGRSMPDAHSGLALTDSDFDAFVEDLRAAMTDLELGPRQQSQILALLGPMRPDIVGQ